MDRNVKINGKKLAEVRKRKLSTQSEIATALGLTVGRVTQIEGKDSVGMYSKNFRSLADLWKMSPESLLEQIGASHTGEATPLIIEIPRDLVESAQAKANAAGIPVDEWIVGEVEAVLKTTAKDTALPHNEAPGLRPLKGGGGMRKAAKK